MKESFDNLAEHLIRNGFFLEEAVEILEKNLIQKVLAETGGNRCAASKRLGIHRNTLQRKIVEYHLDSPRVRRKPPRRVTAASRRALAG